MRNGVVIAILVVVVLAFCLIYGPPLASGTRAAWNNEQYINFWVAWIPFAISILLAFLPDRDMKPAARVSWRVLVILCGLFYSILLWHQQRLAANSSSHQQEQILNQAVTQSNNFTGQKIGAVQQDVQGVKNDIGGVKTDLQKPAMTLLKCCTHRKQISHQASARLASQTRRSYK